MTLNPILNATDDAERALDSGVDNVIAAAEQLRANVKHHLQRIRAAVATAQSAVGNLAVTTRNNPAATPAQQRAVVNAQRDVDRLAQQGQQAANGGNADGVDSTVNELNAIADAANRANAAQAPAPAAPVATQPVQPAQTQPPAPATPVATTPAQPAQPNLWFVGTHPNPQPIVPTTDAFGRQVGTALDNHRDGINSLRGEVDNINHHLGRQDGPNGPTYRPIGTSSSTDIGVPMWGWIVALIVGLWVFLSSDWANQVWFSLLYAITWALVTLAITWGINRLFAHFDNRS